MKRQPKETDSNELFSGVLNIFGIKLDLGELLGSPEELQGRLEELRERLKAVGGKEALSDLEWKKGGVSITGHIRTRGLLGDQEFHVGTMGKPLTREPERPTQEAPEQVEPPTDVFYEGQQVTIVADVPGVGLEDLELKVEDGVFSLSTKATARRRYHKRLPLEAEVDAGSLQATCRNGVLEIRLKKRKGKK